MQRPRANARGVKPPVQYRGGIDPLAHLALFRYVEAHCEWLAVTHYAADTVVTRRRALRTFIAWANERGIDDPREVTKPILERYQRHLFYYRKEDGSPLVPGTQVNLLRAVKTFFKWATRENHILYNPASELDVPKVQRHLPRNILSVDEVAAILNEADCPVQCAEQQVGALLPGFSSLGKRVLGDRTARPAAVQASLLPCCRVNLPKLCAFTSVQANAVLNTMSILSPCSAAPVNETNGENTIQ